MCNTVLECIRFIRAITVAEHTAGKRDAVSLGITSRVSLPYPRRAVVLSLNATRPWTAPPPSVALYTTIYRSAYCSIRKQWRIDNARRFRFSSGRLYATDAAAAPAMLIVRLVNYDAPFWRLLAFFFCLSPAVRVRAHYTYTLYTHAHSLMIKALSCK